VTNHLLDFIWYLLQTNPNQYSIRNVISDDPGFSTLATFQSIQLLNLSVKFLDLPPKPTFFFYGQCAVLRLGVSHNIIRALGRKDASE
jgi:hypothetical protein